jgi:methyl-accepting chemotaxis protein
MTPWCRVGLRWTARLSALTSAVLFVLVLTAIGQERMLHASTTTIVHTFQVNNGYFDERVDFTQTDRIRDDTRELQRTLDEIATAATEDVQLLDTIVPDTDRLLAAGHTDLDIAGELPGIADTLRDTAADILRTAEHADATVTSADTRLAQVAELVERLNRRLAAIDRKLVLPETPGLSAALPAAPGLPGTTGVRVPDRPGVLPR